MLDYVCSAKNPNPNSTSCVHLRNICADIKYIIIKAHWTRAFMTCKRTIMKIVILLNINTFTIIQELQVQIVS